MKDVWTKLMARVDALSLRERVLVFSGVLAVFGLVTYEFFVAPLYEQQKLLSQSLDQQSEAGEVQIGQLKAALKKSSRERVVLLSSELGSIQAQIDAVDGEIAAMTASTVDASALPALLARVLKNTQKVAVVKVVSSKAETTAGAAASSSATPPAAAPALLPSQTQSTSAPIAETPPRGALDITLAGGYLDLMEYLVGLEKALPSVRWSAVKVAADAGPAQVTVRILLPAGS